MDIDGNIINIDLNGSNRGAGANTTANLAWDFGDLHRFPWTTARAAHPEASFDLGFQQPVLYAGGDDGCHFHPDPHLACLRLGKLHYLDEREVGLGKKGKGNYGVPRCQVEGCEAVLVNAKEYHRRHKVCELHSKAPKVVVLGREQRFCQQCSRFHVVSEFDDWKRSCRRRLAGHNERRRKTSSHSLPLDSSSFSINSSQEDNKLMGEKSGRAHSLLSSPEAWISPEDLSSRGSEALRELIAEHRATALARQLLLDHHRDSNALALAAAFPRSTTTILHGHGQGHWDRFQQASAHVTLDLMHVASASPLPFGEPLPKGEGGQLQLWNSLHGNDQNLF